MLSIIKKEFKKMLLFIPLYILIAFLILNIIRNSDSFGILSISSTDRILGQNAISYQLSILKDKSTIIIVALSLFAALYALNDFKNKVVFIELSKGNTKTKIFLSKLLVLADVIMCVLLLINVIYFFIGLIKYKIAFRYSFPIINCIIGINLIFIEYAVIVFCISYIIRSSVISLIYGATYYLFIEWLIGQILNTFFKGGKGLLTIRHATYQDQIINYELHIENFLFKNMINYFYEVCGFFRPMETTYFVSAYYYVAMIIIPAIIIGITILVNNYMERT